MSSPNNLNYSPVIVPELNDAFYAYNPDSISYAFNKTMPFLNVTSSAGYIEAVTAASMQGDASLVRLPGNAFAEIQATIGKVDYILSNLGGEYFSPNDDFRVSQINRDKLAIRLLKSALYNSLETAFATAVMDGYSSNDAITFTDDWSDADTDLVGAIALAIGTITAATGVRPNTLTLSDALYNCLLSNKGVLAKFPGATAVTSDLMDVLLASVLGLKKIVKSTALVSGVPIVGNEYALVSVSATDVTGADASEATVGRTLGVTQSVSEDGMVNPYSITVYPHQPKNALAYQLNAIVKPIVFEDAFSVRIPTNIGS